MGIRFRKSIRVAPGVRINLGKKSVGVSMGGKYGGISVNSKTGARTRISAPGTGLSFTRKIGKAHPKDSDRLEPPTGKTSMLQYGGISKDRWKLFLMSAGFMAFAVLCAVAEISPIISISFAVLSVLGFIFTAVAFCRHWELEDKKKEERSKE